MYASRRSEERERRACESCRRKKCRCTGERPVCSFCQRLNTECVYLPRGNTTNPGTSSGITKVPSPQDSRFRMLESRITELYSMLNSSHNNDPVNSVAGSQALELGQSSPYQASDAIQESSTSAMTESSVLPNISLPTIPGDMMNHLIDTYCATLHFQPLPLFNITNLRETLAKSPWYLVWSFMALTSCFTAPEYLSARQIESIKLNAKPAENTITSLATDGLPTVEIGQSLCLLALKNVFEMKLSRAWMFIGIASRLEGLRHLKRKGVNCQAGEEDEISRCFWSIFILEKTFGPHNVSAPEFETAPEFPSSSPTPASLFDIGDDVGQDTGEPLLDLGISSYYIKMLLIWGKVSSYLHRIHAGMREVPWLCDSIYTKLNIEIFEFETELHPAHRVRNRTSAGSLHPHMGAEQQYWNPWLTVQIMSHACPALLNHPFLHLVVMQGRGQKRQSRMFLQQVVDQALFHSGWVLRILGFFETLPFTTNDPLIGNLVAAISTIPWIFQFARDPRVSLKASEEVAKYVTILERMSTVWPHLSNKLETLQSLQITASCQVRHAEAEHATFSFHSSKIWNLLDLNLSESLHEDYAGSEETNDQPPDVRMHVKTHYVQQLDDPKSSTTETGDPMAPSWLGADNTEASDIDHSMFPFAPDDFEWLRTF